MKPTLFISHATNDKTVAEQVMAEFAQAFVPFLDSHDVKAGGDWRREIEDKLLECHAAVILLSEHSIGRPWVRDEAWILAMLARKFPQRVVIPLLVDGFPVERLSDPLLAPAQLDARQARAIDSNNLDLTAVQEALAPIAAQFAERSQWIRFERYLATKLSSLKTDGLEAVAEALQLDSGIIHFAGNPHRWLAARLLAVHDLNTLDRFVRALADHAGGTLAENHRLATELLSEVLPYCWVDIGVVRQMAERLVQRDSPRTMVGLVADEAATAKCYVDCAAARAPLDSWPVFECTTGYSAETDIDDVVAEIMAQAGEAVWQCEVPFDSNEPDDELRDCWQEFTKDSGPLVVLFPTPFSDADRDFFDRLNRKFQQLNFVVVCPPHGSAFEQRFTHFVLLPAPRHNKSRADRAYDHLHKRLTQGL